MKRSQKLDRLWTSASFPAAYQGEFAGLYSCFAIAIRLVVPSVEINHRVALGPRTTE